MFFDIDLSKLPAEGAFYEYKCGDTPWERLRLHVGKAASAFWNSGGGVLVIGAKSDGSLDQGINSHYGRTPIRDWIDQVISEVHPRGAYTIQMYDRSTLEKVQSSSGKVILVIFFEESHQAPHMAPDNRYYIRGGAHSFPAPSYVVEGLWARRYQRQPKLLHMLRISRDKAEALQLVVVNASPEPALNVELVVDPVPEMWQRETRTRNPFPLKYPLVDKANPIELDIATWVHSDERIGPYSRISLKYEDISGNVYSYEEQLLIASYPPWRVDKDSTSKRIEALKKLEQTIIKGFDGLRKTLEKGLLIDKPSREETEFLSYGFRVVSDDDGKSR